MWDLVPWPGIEPGPPALGAQILRQWITREVPEFPIFDGIANTTKAIDTGYNGFRKVIALIGNVPRIHENVSLMILS